jgi:hypothetical protein
VVHAAGAEATLGNLEPLTRFTDNIVPGNTNLVEPDLCMTMRGVPVTSVNHLATYGVFSSVSGIKSAEERTQLLDSFARMYAPAIGTGQPWSTWGRPG